jgi:hypothetical protein
VAVNRYGKFWPVFGQIERAHARVVDDDSWWCVVSVHVNVDVDILKNISM